YCASTNRSLSSMVITLFVPGRTFSSFNDVVPKNRVAGRSGPLVASTLSVGGAWACAFGAMALMAITSTIIRNILFMTAVTSKVVLLELLNRTQRAFQYGHNYCATFFMGCP